MRTEISYLFVAVALSGLVVYPWDLGDMGLDPRLRPFAAVFGFLWTCRRAVVFWKAWRRWRSWRLPATWSVKAEDLPFQSVQHRLLRRCLAWSLRQLLSSEAVPDRAAGLPSRLNQAFGYRMGNPWARSLLRWLQRRVCPDKGLLLGRAFRWSPEHTQELETHLQKGQPLPVGRDMRGGYPALHAVGKKEEQPLVLPWSELVGHVLIGGTTRSGKTRLLEVILCEAIRGPGTVIVIDPKGDAELLIRAATEAHRSGRRFALFSPAHPDQSASFNPFSMCDNTTELAARVQALMPGGGGMAKGDPFFTEYPLAVVERLGAAQDAIGDDWTIEGLHAVTTMVPPFDDLVSRYLYDVLGGRDNWTPSLEELIEEYTRKRGEKQDALADALIDDKEKPRDHFVQVTANLVPAFRGVTGGKMARLLSSENPDLTWDGVVKERTVVYFAMSSLLYGEVANRIGRVILQDLIGFLGRRYALQDPAKMTPLTILIDEFSNVAYPGFIDALNKGGGAKANIMLAMQSLADPEAAMGKDGTQRVLDNLNTRIWFRLTDDATAKLAVEGLGMTSVSREDISHSLSFGGSGGTSGGSRGAMQYVDRSLVRSEWVTGLPRGEAFVRTRGENWKLRVPLLKPVGRKEVREVAAEYGLGGVLADLKEKAKESGSARERLRNAQENGKPAESSEESTARSSGKSAEAGKGSQSAVAARKSVDRLREAVTDHEPKTDPGSEDSGQGVKDAGQRADRLREAMTDHESKTNPGSEDSGQAAEDGGQRTDRLREAMMDHEPKTDPGSEDSGQAVKDAGQRADRLREAVTDHESKADPDNKDSGQGVKGPGQSAVKRLMAAVEETPSALGVDIVATVETGEAEPNG